VKAKRLKAINNINNDILSIFNGSLLGDAHMERRELGKGTRISFSQESNRSEYLI